MFYDRFLMRLHRMRQESWKPVFTTSMNSRFDEKGAEMYDVRPPAKAEGWEERFDKEFDGLFPGVTVSARQAGDFDRARKIESIYRQLPEAIKEFIRSELARKDAEARKEETERIRKIVLNNLNLLDPDIVHKMLASLERPEGIAAIKNAGIDWRKFKIPDWGERPEKHGKA